MPRVTDYQSVGQNGAQDAIRDIAQIVQAAGGATAEVLSPSTQEAASLYEKYKFLWGFLTGGAAATLVIYFGSRVWRSP